METTRGWDEFTYCCQKPKKSLFCSFGYPWCTIKNIAENWIIGCN